MTDQPTLEDCISKVIENAEDDRAKAYALLSELENEMTECKNKGDMEKHENAGETASKYLKVIQRSNEQIIKVIKSLRRIEKQRAEEDINSTTSSSIYDEIANTDEEVVFDDEELEVEKEDGEE